MALYKSVYYFYYYLITVHNRLSMDIDLHRKTVHEQIFLFQHLFMFSQTADVLQWPTPD